MKHCLKQRDKIRKRNRALIPASDDWFPSMEGGMVLLIWSPESQRIAVWGDDDFGMEKWNATEAEFKELKGLVVSQAMLKKRGFSGA